MLHLYDNLDSGNGYKARLLLALLGHSYAWTDLDIDHGATRTPEFLAKNPNGRIPTLELEDGSFLPESNAILWYLAEGTPWIPEGRFARAQVLQWMFFEQYSHEPYIAVARFIVAYLGRPAAREADLAAKMAPGHKALAVMERQLATTPFLCGDDYTIADIALYAYTHVAHEGEFDLAPYPPLRDWLARVRAQPGHVEMIRS